jgi:hypothetical protein
MHLFYKKYMIIMDDLEEFNTYTFAEYFFLNSVM